MSNKPINGARIVRNAVTGAVSLLMGRGRTIRLPGEGEEALAGLRNADGSLTLSGDGAGAVAGATRQTFASPVRRYSPSWALLAQLRATIISNGGTVDERDLVSIRDPLDALVKSSAWAKLKELWLPVGNGYLAAMCKIKGASTLVMTGTNIVDGDYTRWLGLTGNGSTKFASTGFTPTGLTGNWGCGVYPTGPTAPKVNQVLCGDGVATYVGFAGTGSGGSMKIDGSLTANLVTAAVQRFMAVQNSGVGQSAWYGGLKEVSANGTAATNTGQLSLLKHNTFFADTSVGGFAAWSPVMTSNELKSLSAFFDAANYALGRLGILNAVNFCGDSNTSGQGVTSAERWPKLLADMISATEINNGLPGYPMAGASGFSQIVKGNRSATSGIYLTVMLGTNDDRQGVTVAEFTSAYETWLNYQFQIGWNPGNLVLIAPPSVAAAGIASGSSRERLQVFGQVVRSLALKYGCLFADAFSATDGNAANFQSDGLHESPAGHVAIANAVYAAIALDSYAAALRS